jgi:hypothetical protein
MRDGGVRIVNEAFNGEKAAQKKLQEAFEDFINTDVRCASYLALYVDDLLKRCATLLLSLSECLLCYIGKADRAAYD